jgi:hypothetical protein
MIEIFGRVPFLYFSALWTPAYILKDTRVFSDRFSRKFDDHQESEALASEVSI